MAASIIRLMESTADTVTVTRALDVPVGGFGSATFLWIITSITGTWDAVLRLNINGQTIAVTTAASQTTTGVKRLALTTDFNAVKMAIPVPNEVTLNESIAGSITSEIWMIAGD